MTADVPGILDRSALAAPPRTLLDILRETTLAHPDASALEDADGALSYRELMARVVRTAARLHAAGVRRGDRVGIRMPSGSRDLYIAILGVMAAGAAYVPVDADDPEERARLVFGEAGVRGVITAGARSSRRAASANRMPRPRRCSTARRRTPARTRPPWRRRRASTTTRGSSSPRDRPARRRASRSPTARRPRSSTPRRGCSCRARRSGPGTACWPASRWPSTRPARRCGSPGGTAPASCPHRARSCAAGMDLGPWLVDARHHGRLDGADARRAVAGRGDRERAAADLRRRGRARPSSPRGSSPTEREVWNTYGPTEATVVACAALLDGTGPVRIGLPLDGWALAVVDAEGHPVAEGEIGELIIGGVGLARYLDPAKDAEKYAPMPTLGWERAYRWGDLVRVRPRGPALPGPRRRPGEGRRPPHRARRDRVGAAGAPAVVGRGRRRAAHRGRQPGARRLPRRSTDGFDRAAAARRARRAAPGRARAAARGRRRAPDPHLRQGRPGRPALAAARRRAATSRLSGHPPPGSPSNGRPCSECRSRSRTRTSSTSAAGPSRPRSWSRASGPATRSSPSPTSTTYPRLGSMADELEARAPEPGDGRVTFRQPSPTPRGTQWVQTLVGVPLFILSGARWLLYLLTATTILDALGAGSNSCRRCRCGCSSSASSSSSRPFGRMAIASWSRGSCSPARARRLPARRRGAPAHVARRPDRPPGRRGRARRRPVGAATTPARWARGSARTSTCTRCRRSPAC